MLRPIVILALFGVTLATGGCAAAKFLETASRGIFPDQEVNLIDRNYAVADYLAGVTKASISRDTPIIQKPLLHANNTGMTSAFGKLITDQVGARLSQLGYTVIKNDNDNLVATQGARLENGGVILGGSYVPGDLEVNVALRLIDQGSGKVVGSYDYIIPVNNEIAEMLEDQPVIFRLPAGAAPLPASVP